MVIGRIIFLKNKSLFSGGSVFIFGNEEVKFEDVKISDS